MLLYLHPYFPYVNTHVILTFMIKSFLSFLLGLRLFYWFLCLSTLLKEITYVW